jgi:hypothetical protein
MNLFNLVKDGLDLFDRWPRVRERLKDTRFGIWLEKPLPKVDPSKGFGVAVAHLENDENHEFEHLICVQLEKMKDFQVVRFDRKILVSSLDQGSALGHDRARRFLEESGAHVLVWGNVIRIGNSGAPRLYFTTLRHGISAEEPYSVRAFKLPEVFWHDLADIVSLMTLGLQAELQPGHQSYDELSSFIDRVNELLEWSRNQPGWTEFNRLRVEFAVGTGLCSRGKNLHQKDDLKKALRIFRSSRLRPKGSSTSEWSAFQETVGQTVFFSARELAEADGCPEVELYDLVIASLREALDGLSAVYAPVHRALCLFQLGTAMQLRDLIAPDYTLTEEALAAFEQCAKLWKPDTDALRWGLAKTKIGEVLTRIGIAQKNEELLYQSVLHCLDARKRLATLKDDYSLSAVSALLAAGKAVDALKALGDPTYDRFAPRIDKAFLESSNQRSAE